MPTTDDIRQYWDVVIHDMQMTQAPEGSPQFFADLAAYRYEKLAYLPEAVDFSAYRDKRVLEVGCGVGIDLARFAAHGAQVTGIDLAPRAVALAQQNFRHKNLDGEFQVMDGEAMTFANESFDMAYAHGVLQYTANPRWMVDEIHRVLAPGGTAIFMVYNRHSWLNTLSLVTQVDIEHAHAPVIRKYTDAEVRRLLERFASVRTRCERFPVKTRLHPGLGGWLYNAAFVPLFNTIPRSLVRPLGWHIMVYATKGTATQKDTQQHEERLGAAL
jgi:SAM-dependent methyltransferase